MFAAWRRRIAADPGDTDVPYEDVVNIHIVTGTLSIIGGLLILAMFAWDRRLGKKQMGMIVWLITLCDMAYTLKFLVPAVLWQFGFRNERDSFHVVPDNCLSSAVYGMLFSMAIISWNACGIIDLLITISRPLFSTRKNMPWYHLAVWGSSLGAAVFVWAEGLHEFTADHTCWVRADAANSGVFDAFLVAYISLACISLVAAVRAACCAGTRFSRQLRRRILLRHAAYVIAFMVMWTWPLVHRDFEDQVWLTQIDAFTVSGQALVLAIIRLAEPGAAVPLRSMRRALASSVAAWLRAVRARDLPRVCCCRAWRAAFCQCRLRRCCKQGEARRGGRDEEGASVAEEELAGACCCCCCFEDAGAAERAEAYTALDGDDPQRTGKRSSRRVTAEALAMGIARARSGRWSAAAVAAQRPWAGPKRGAAALRSGSFVRGASLSSVGWRGVGGAEAPGAASGAAAASGEGGIATEISMTKMSRGRFDDSDTDASSSVMSASEWESVGAGERVAWAGVAGDPKAFRAAERRERQALGLRVLNSRGAAFGAGQFSSGEEDSEGGDQALLLRDADEAEAEAMAAVVRAAELLKQGGIDAWRAGRRGSQSGGEPGRAGAGVCAAASSAAGGRRVAAAVWRVPSAGDLLASGGTAVGRAAAKASAPAPVAGARTSLLLAAGSAGSAGAGYGSFAGGREGSGAPAGEQDGRRWTSVLRQGPASRRAAAGRSAIIDASLRASADGKPGGGGSRDRAGGGGRSGSTEAGSNGSETAVGEGGRRAMGGVPLAGGAVVTSGRGRPPPPPPRNPSALGRRATGAGAPGADSVRSGGAGGGADAGAAGSWVVWPRPSRAVSAPWSGSVALGIDAAGASGAAAPPPAQSVRTPPDVSAAGPRDSGKAAPRQRGVRLRIVATHTPLVRSALVRLRSNSAGEWMPGCSNSIVEGLVADHEDGALSSGSRVDLTVADAAAARVMAGAEGEGEAAAAAAAVSAVAMRAQGRGGGAATAMATASDATRRTRSSSSTHSAGQSPLLLPGGHTAANEAAVTRAKGAALLQALVRAAARSPPLPHCTLSGSWVIGGDALVEAGELLASDSDGVGAWLSSRPTVLRPIRLEDPHPPAPAKLPAEVARFLDERDGKAAAEAAGPPQWAQTTAEARSGKQSLGLPAAGVAAASGGLGVRAGKSSRGLLQGVGTEGGSTATAGSRSKAAGAKAAASAAAAAESEPSSGWDVGEGLRTELSLCVLSGLCQTVLQSEMDYGLARTAQSRRRPAHSEAPRVAVAEIPPAGTHEEAEWFARDAEASRRRKGAGWWSSAAPDSEEVVDGPVPPPERTPKLGEVLAAATTAPRQLRLLTGFSRKAFQEAARKAAQRATAKQWAAPAHVPAAGDGSGATEPGEGGAGAPPLRSPGPAVPTGTSSVVPATGRLTPLGSAGGGGWGMLRLGSMTSTRSSIASEARRRSSVRYRPPAGSLVSIALGGRVSVRSAGAGILEEGADSSDTDFEEDGEGPSGRGAGHGSHEEEEDAAAARGLSPLAEDDRDDDDDGGGGDQSPMASGRFGGQSRPRAESELAEPLTMSSGLDGAQQSLLGNGGAWGGGGRERARSKPRPLASMFWVAPRRRGRRRSSLMDEFQVHSIEDELFAKLRAQLGISAVQFARAFDPGLLLDGRLKAHFSEGASRSFFCRSANEDMIVKTIEEKEVEELAALLPAYVQHLANNPDSLLCRFLALLVVNVRGVGSLYCLVMQNAFPFGNLGSHSFVFDLKGSTVGRKAKEKPGKASTVKSQAKASGLMLDQDFRAMLPQGVPLQSAQLVSELTAQVMRDVTLLAAYGLMDYSCLVAITPVPAGSQARVHSPEPARRMVSAPPRRWSTFSAVVSELPEWHPSGSPDAADTAAPGASTPPAARAASSAVSGGTTVIVQLGIVDLLQSFDLGKQLEHRFKRLMRMGRSANISAVPAEQYAYRFAEFVSDVLAGEDISLK